MIEIYLKNFILQVLAYGEKLQSNEIDNNQQVYEAQIQVPRYNSILKAGSLECQKLRPLSLLQIKHISISIIQFLKNKIIFFIKWLWGPPTKLRVKEDYGGKKVENHCVK